MSIVSSPRKLYVIGNGFDLHHGLPCGYADFRAWLQVNRPDVHRELIRLYGESDSDLWRDFEKGLSCFDLDNYPNDVKRADLVKLKDGLNEAFGGWVKTIGAPGKEKAIEDIDKSAVFFTFNYTRTLEDFYGIDESRVVHLHGVVDNGGFIYGHDRSPNDMDDEDIPIEERTAAREKLGLPDGMTIVSFGGSLGANKISECVVSMMKWEQEQGGINHIHSYGGNGKDMFEGLLRSNGISLNERFRAREYIDNMYTCLCAADLVISRAGAMTLTELKAVGRASILIPFPQAAENHQYYNALTMSKNGAAILIEDKELTPERLLSEVKSLHDDRRRLTEMGEAAAALNIPNSTDLVVGNILDLVK